MQGITIVQALLLLVQGNLRNKEMAESQYFIAILAQLQNPVNLHLERYDKQTEFHQQLMKEVPCRVKNL